MVKGGEGFPPPAGSSGLAIVESFFDEPLSNDLVRGIVATPDDQIAVLAAKIEEISGWEYKYLEEPAPRRGDWSEGPYVVAESLIRDDATPVVQRDNLDLILLHFERLVVADPILKWVHDIRRPEWGWSGEWGTKNSSLPEQLASILKGFVGLKPEIDSGELVFSPPPRRPEHEFNRLFVNPTTRATLFDAINVPLFTSPLEGASRSYSDLSVHLSHHFNSPEIWEAVARYIFDTAPEPLLRIVSREETWTGLGEKLKDAVCLDDYASMNESTPIAMTSYTARFLQSAAATSGGAVTPIFEVPRLDLTVREALQVRRGEETFAAFRRGCQEILSVVGTAAPGESSIGYAERIREAANGCLAEAVDDLTRLKSKGKVLGRWLPAAAGMAFSMGIKAIAPVPGAAIPAKAASGHLLRGWLKEMEAAETALRFVTNLQLAGRL